MFVFGAMLEYSGILLLVKLEKMNVTPLKYLYPVSSSFPPSTAHSVNPFFQQRSRHSQRFTRTDMVFFCIFPVLFLLFNLVYWWSVVSWRRDTWAAHTTPDRYNLDPESWGENIHYTGDTGAL